MIGDRYESFIIYVYELPMRYLEESLEVQAPMIPDYIQHTASMPATRSIRDWE